MTHTLIAQKFNEVQNKSVFHRCMVFLRRGAGFWRYFRRFAKYLLSRNGLQLRIVCEVGDPAPTRQPKFFHNSKFLKKNDYFNPRRGAIRARSPASSRRRKSGKSHAGLCLRG